MRVIISGGTGFIGRHLVEALQRRGDSVSVLTRGESRQNDSGVQLVHWDPAGSGQWQAAIDGQDAVVHLAGAQAVGVRWSKKKKRQILDSRVRSTEQLASAMKRAERPPSVFLCASGVSHYGARPSSDVVDEGGSAGSDFLAEVTKQWEAAAEGATTAGVRVVRARLGIVFGKEGGALLEMVKPFKMFVGGPIGSGEQVVSWVHIDDVVGIFLRCLDDASIRGPVNVTSPNAVTNAELSKAIGEVLHRPSAMRVPAAALKMRFGEGAEPILTGQRAVPAVMQAKGYAFRFSNVKDALEQVL